MPKITPKDDIRENKTISHPDILAAASLYRAGAATLGTLAKRFQVSVSTLKRHFKAMNVRRGENSEKVANAMEETVQSELTRDVGKIAQQIAETRESTRKAADFVQRLGVKLLVDQIREKKSPALLQNEMKTLLNAAQMLKILQDIQFNSLGVINKDSEPDDALPVLGIIEKTAEEIREETKQQMQIGDDNALPPPEYPDLAEDNDIIEEGIDESAPPLNDGSSPQA